MTVITENALHKHINRALFKQQLKLKKCAWNSRWYRDLGNYYMVCLSNVVDCPHIDIEDLGREPGVMRPSE